MLTQIIRKKQQRRETGENRETIVASFPPDINCRAGGSGKNFQTSAVSGGHPQGKADYQGFDEVRELTRDHTAALERAILRAAQQSFWVHPPLEKPAGRKKRKRRRRVEESPQPNTSEGWTW
jgi:hypothetical protein